MRASVRTIVTFLLLAGGCIVSYSFAQPAGKVIEYAKVSSSILKKQVNYSVYLPADYDLSQRSYPVVYLLHGYTDDNTAWLQFGEVNRYADKAIADGTIPPMIIIMPDADSSWYINSYDNKERYEDFFIQEFIPAIEKTYRIKSEKRFRGVAGLSMGGYGTLIYALKYPDTFAAAAPLSSGVFSDEEMLMMPDSQWDRIMAPLYGKGLKGKERLSKAWYANSILKIVDEKSGADLNKVRYWIDCGDDDFLFNGNSLLHIALRKKLVKHEYRVREGGHTWLYWRTGITDALAFIGESFR
ncbi:MAG: esterase family protein [Chitinophagaceae bacterium]|nr:esterase family protein [Chitinophagaceae bacterium]